MTDFYPHFMQVSCYKGLIDSHYKLHRFKKHSIFPRWTLQTSWSHWASSVLTCNLCSRSTVRASQSGQSFSSSSVMRPRDSSEPCTCSSALWARQWKSCWVSRATCWDGFRPDNAMFSRPDLQLRTIAWNYREMNINRYFWISALNRVNWQSFSTYMESQAINSNLNMPTMRILPQHPHLKQKRARSKFSSSNINLVFKNRRALSCSTFLLVYFSINTNSDNAI